MNEDARPVATAELAELAARADEAGQNILSVALLQVLRGWREAPSTQRYTLPTVGRV